MDTIAKSESNPNPPNIVPILSRERGQSGYAPWLKAIVYPLGKYLVLPRYFSQIEVFGQEHLPENGAVILAPTHRSRWDALVLPYAVGPYVTGRDVRFMVSANEMKGIQGWFIRRLGGFPVDPLKPGASTIRHSIELMHRGEMLTIFPEGNIFREPELQPLKKGLARIAMQAIAMQPDLDLKIIPVSIRYSQPVPTFRDRVSLNIGTPLSVSEYQHLSTKAGAQILTQDLAQKLTDAIAMHDRPFGTGWRDRI
jgi:1-acyl-sn-glycerol-3-phosphate acyltransferase